MFFRPALLRSAIVLALGLPAVPLQAAAVVEAGSGVRQDVTGDIAASGFREAALSAYDGGSITGTTVSLSSKSGTLIHAAAGGTVTLEGVTMGKSLGPVVQAADGGQVTLSDVVFTTDDYLSVTGEGSRLTLKNSRPPSTGTTFDVTRGALVLENVRMESTPSGSGAALIRTGQEARVTLTDATLTTHDHSVLSLTGGSTAEVNNSTLTTRPTRPDEIGSYPVIQAGNDSRLILRDTTLQFDQKGIGLYVGGGSTATVQGGGVEGQNLSGYGSAVQLTGTGSLLQLNDARIRLDGDASAMPGSLTGIYVGQGGEARITGTTVETDGTGITGIQGDYSRLFLDQSTVRTLQGQSTGMALFGSDATVTKSRIESQGGQAAALAVYDSENVTLHDSRLMANSAPAMFVSSGVATPLSVDLENTQVRGALYLQERITRVPVDGVNVRVALRQGTLMEGDIRVTGENPGSVFSLSLSDRAILNGKILASGGQTALAVSHDSSWKVPGDSELQRLENAGQIQTTAPGTTIHVREDYTGQGGELHFTAALAGDASVTDRLVVDGSTSGTTAVSVTNAGGTGDRTLNGIELIRVGGTSAGEFIQSGRIVAGAYDYRLVRGAGAQNGNWYLVSGAVPEPVPQPVPAPEPVPEPEHVPQPEPAPVPERVPQPEPTPAPEPAPEPSPQPVPEQPAAPETEPASRPVTVQEPWIRPEAGIYTANLTAANTLFISRLHDRLGETRYVDALTGEELVTSMWLRQAGGHSRFRDSSGQLSTRASRYVLQLGGDIARWDDGRDSSLHLGVTGGYARQKSHSRNGQSGYRTRGSISGYSAGLYGTWLQNHDAGTGAWVDTWLLYSRFDNRVSGESLRSEGYRSKGLTASAEAGYTWKAGEHDAHTGYYLQPKAQVIRMGVKAGGHTEANGTRVSGRGHGNVQTRLGVRAFMKAHSRPAHGKPRTVEPFAEVNWLHNSRHFGTVMNGVSMSSFRTKDSGEVKAGVEAVLAPDVHLQGTVAQQADGKGYSDTSAMLGIKIRF